MYEGGIFKELFENRRNLVTKKMLITYLLRTLHYRIKVTLP